LSLSLFSSFRWWARSYIPACTSFQAIFNSNRFPH